MPLIELSFSCDDAWVHNTEADRKLDSLAFKGYYTNGAGRSLKTSELRILNMNAKPGKGIFKGNFVMRDFTDPKILMQVNGDLQLEFYRRISWHQRLATNNRTGDSQNGFKNWWTSACQRSRW